MFYARLLVVYFFPSLVIRCPYCKMLNYAVEYRGVKTKEEKGVEQIVSARETVWLVLLSAVCSVFVMPTG